jgi:hypothetical protein
MLRWARVSLVINALLPALAVFFLLIAPDTTHIIGTAEHLAFGLVNLTICEAKKINDAACDLRIRWIILAAASCILSALFLASNIAPRPYGKTVYKPMPK